MFEVRVYNNINKYEKISDIECATTFKDRLIGLMNKTHFSGLIFRQYNGSRLNGAIHTHFMKKTIDIIYVDNNNVVSEVVTLKPWKYYLPENGNIKYIIELPENSITKYHIMIGTKVKVVKT